MPYSERHRLGIPWEVFNVTNTPHFDTASLKMSIEDPATFGTYSSMLGGPRRMQFVAALRVLSVAFQSRTPASAGVIFCRPPHRSDSALL
jgi:hypothetical protein